MVAGGNGCHDAWLAESVWPILGKHDCATDCSAHNRGILTTLSKTYRAEGATVMSVCIFGESALEFMRSSGRLAPGFLDRPRTQKLDGCGISPKAMFTDDMERLGVKTRPVHILVSKESGARSRDDIVCHRSAAELPPRSLIYVNRDVLVTSPALTFLHLATVDLHKKRQRTVEELAMIGLELCGTYLLDDSWDGLTNTAKPLTSVEQITRVLDAMPGAPGVVLAREALVLVGDGSNSPMESVLCALLTWPRRLGGYALGPVSLNHRVSTADGDRYVDVAFPGHKVGLEYKGRKFHAIEQAGRDDRRQNKLVGSGWTILNVWYEDIVKEHLYNQLVADVARAMGIRLRIRSGSFDARRNVLRMQLIPAFKRYAAALAR